MGRLVDGRRPVQRLPCRNRQITLRFPGEPSFLAEPIDWADLAGSAGYFPGHALDSWPLPTD